MLCMCEVLIIYEGQSQLLVSMWNIFFVVYDRLWVLFVMFFLFIVIFIVVVCLWQVFDNWGVDLDIILCL